MLHRGANLQEGIILKDGLSSFVGPRIFFTDSNFEKNNVSFDQIFVLFHSFKIRFLVFS